MSDVPCGECTLCCTWVDLDGRPTVEEDEASQYQTEIHGDRRVLATKEDSNDCYYLGDEGCSIHTFAPKACKEFDCRDVPQKFSPDVLHMSLIIAQGFKLGMKS